MGSLISDGKKVFKNQQTVLERRLAAAGFNNKVPAKLRKARGDLVKSPKPKKKIIRRTAEQEAAVRANNKKVAADIQSDFDKNKAAREAFLAADAAKYKPKGLRATVR